MSIQSNINQTISLAGFLISRTPEAQNRREGLEYQSKQVQAIAGLKDIETNLDRAAKSDELELKPEDKDYKHYGEDELKNIEARTQQYQKDIYDAKSAYLNPRLSKYINPEEIKQGELSSQLDKIREARTSAMNRLQSRKEEQTASDAFAKMITEGVVPNYGLREVIRYGE